MYKLRVEERAANEHDDETNPNIAAIKSSLGVPFPKYAAADFFEMNTWIIEENA